MYRLITLEKHFVIYIIGGLLVALFLTGVCHEPVFAATTGQSEFTVEPVTPKNQKVKATGAFILDLKSGDQQSLTVNVLNLTDKDIRVRTRGTVALTGDDGQIDYASGINKFDTTLRLNFTKMGVGKATFTVPAKKAVPVTQKITVPKTNFNGVVLGGLLFQAVDDSGSSKNSKGIVLRNKYQFTVPTMLSINNANDVLPNLRIDTVIPQAGSTEPEVISRFHNFEPQYIGSDTMAVDARVYYRGGTKAIAKTKRSGLNFAPNSTFNYAVGMGGTRVQPGAYTLKAIVTQGGVRTWHLTKNFNITGEEANKMNAVGKKKNGGSLWIFILLGILFLILIVSVVVLTYFFSKRKAVNQLMRNQNSKLRQHE